MGDDYVLLRVNVLTRPAKIKHDQQQSSQEVVYGGHLRVDCVASGLPNPEISWALPDGTMVNPDKQEDGFGVGQSRRYELSEILIVFHSVILSFLYCRLLFSRKIVVSVGTVFERTFCLLSINNFLMLKIFCAESHFSHFWIYY